MRSVPRAGVTGKHTSPVQWALTCPGSYLFGAHVTGRGRSEGGCAGCSADSGAAPKVGAVGVASPTCSQCLSARGPLSKSKAVAGPHANSVVWLFWEVKLEGSGKFSLNTMDI